MNAIIVSVAFLVLEILGYDKKGLSIAFLVALALSAVFGWLLARFSLSSVIETNELLDRLLKDTLHELNIPVATITANVSMLKKNESDPKRVKRLERISKAASQLLLLYKNLDYYIKKEIQKETREEFDLKELIKERLEFFEDIRGDIRIKTDLESTFVKADRNGFAKAVDNLISNAIKYNKKGGFVKVVLKESSLIIEDSGIGMDESEILKIFERYYQSSDSADGYGIGLNIVKSFCDENFISISIESKKGHGTKITLLLDRVLTQI